MALSRELKVGAFALMGVVVMALVVFLIGDARRLFSSKDVYHASFQDIEGLMRGSPVRMGGLDVGHISDVEYSSDPRKDDIRVSMMIVSEEARRIREDTVATISPKGLLGDKMIILTVGSPDLPPLQPGAVIPSQPSEDMFSQAKVLGEKAQVVLSNLESTTGTIADAQFREDLRQTMASVRGVVEALEKGEGYVPQLLHDKAEAQKLSRTLSNLETTSSRLNKVLSNLDQAVGRVNSGPGLAHELIYGEDGSKAAEQIGHAAEELALTLEAIRNGDGVAHDLLFGGGNTDSEKIASDLASITGDLRVVVRQIREGKGTVGALLADPSVYEDLKVLLGNVQRNEVLRALVRYSIKRDETQRGAEVRDPEPPPSKASDPSSASNP